MGITVHEPMLEYHIREYSYQTPAHLLGVEAQLLDFVGLVDLDSLDELHNYDPLRAVLAEYLRDV